MCGRLLAYSFRFRSCGGAYPLCPRRNESPRGSPAAPSASDRLNPAIPQGPPLACSLALILQASLSNFSLYPDFRMDQKRSYWQAAKCLVRRMFTDIRRQVLAYDCALNLQTPTHRARTPWISVRRSLFYLDEDYERKPHAASLSAIPPGVCHGI